MSAAARRAPAKARRTSTRRGTRRFVIVTGLSGSGKTHALRALEDLGYFCVDNLPTQLIPTLAELAGRDDAGLDKVALVVDIRESAFLREFPGVLKGLRSNPRTSPTLIFLEASHSSLVRRFSETRRPHPLARGRSVADGIREEREKLAAIRSMADMIVDTSQLTVHELRDIFMRMSRDGGGQRAEMVVTLLSFGFKHGLPEDADLAFDVRCLPNPHFVDRLRRLTGRDPQGGALHAPPQGDQGLHRSAGVVPGLRPAALRPRGQDILDRGDRLHRRPAPFGDGGRDAEAPAARCAGRAPARDAPRFVIAARQGDPTMSTHEPNRVEKPWGYELHWAKTDRYVGKILHINAGHALSLQYHNVKDETVMVQSGKLLYEIEIDGVLTKREMNPGDVIHVTPEDRAPDDGDRGHRRARSVDAGARRCRPARRSIRAHDLRESSFGFSLRSLGRCRGTEDRSPKTEDCSSRRLERNIVVGERRRRRLVHGRTAPPRSMPPPPRPPPPPPPPSSVTRSALISVV